MVYGIASALPKLAVLDVYLSVFTERWARYTLLVTGFVIISNAIVYVPTTITQCTPMAFLWDHSIPGGKCNNVTLHYSLASLPNIVTDLVMLILPIPIVWNLHLERTTKAGVLATFLSGGMYVYTLHRMLQLHVGTILMISSGLIASIVRFATFLQWTPASNSTAKIGSASLVETCSYLIAACLLSMRPLVRRFIGSVMSTSSSRSFGYNERQKSEVKASGFESWKLGPREKGWKEVGERMDMGELGMGRGDEGRLELKTVRVGEHEAKFPRRPLPLVSRSSNSLV
jgi:hypothetical protein